MINSDTRIDEALLLRYFEGEVTLSEKDEIEKWIISSEANKKLAKQIYYPKIRKQSQWQSQLQ